MNTIFTKLRDIVGLNQPVDYEYEYDEMDQDRYQNVYQEESLPAPAADTTASRTRQALGAPSVGAGMSNVIGLPGAANGISEVVVMEPRSFEEMPQAIQALRGRKSVVLNLTLMDPDQAQRAVDFIAGGTYALDGHQERIGESIFLFTPSCVQVSTQSGVVHDVLQPHLRASRPAGTPAWPIEATRMAQ